MGLLGIACLCLLVVPPPLGASVAGPGSRSTAVGYGGGVVTTDDEATRTAESVLAAGGNSVDAALAAAAVLAVRAPQAGGLGGGSAVLHVDGADGTIRLVDGCRPAGAYTAWSAASQMWGSPGFAGFLGPARELAHKPLATTLRVLQRSPGTSFLSDLAHAGTAAPSLNSLPARAEGGVRVAGGLSARGGHVAADAYVSVVVADRRGDVTAVVDSMGRRGGSGDALGTTGVVVGAALPEACGDALPTVVMRAADGPQPSSVVLALAATSGRRPSAGSADAAGSQRRVLQQRVVRGAPLDAAVDAQPASVLAVELDPDGQVHAASESRHGGSAAVVHDSSGP